MQRPYMTTFNARKRALILRRLFLWILAIGPGVIGMVADNDAGGMLSYLVTGSQDHLQWFLPALFVMAPLTYVIQELALRVALATRLPYSQIISRKFGQTIAKFNALVLHGLNMMILVTEFIGMTSALTLLGVPWTLGLIVSLILVLGVTSFRRYRQMERLLLILAVANLAFIPSLMTLHPSVHSWRSAFSGSFTGETAFLLLSLAGNAIAPWMIFWQQNAVWAGNVQNLTSGRKDIRLGIIVQVFMATVVMLIGAFAAHAAVTGRNPLLWLQHYGGTTAAALFAIGLFDAGFLAASTISISSAWMVQEAFADKLHDRSQSPTQGPYAALHIATVSVAALVVLLPHLSAARIALWAQALGALWMPISLLMLGIIASDRRLMGTMVMHRQRQIILTGTIFIFVLLAFCTFVG
ncbi:Mn2+ and Fe2+ transporters of the NRAMP family [Sulfobacillus thermosulfidooxidans DSM 9293]|uniref:Mn2+ and Fe2+ transporters of the NRAMP family n=1 Tax=Sulfobacillus thermosulfidooxidans (strain DSM 9293 / VKM B-1269 / AT-1) TaxID=929705 RepID=A0A1W1W849_SULTA|nr:divalent metal cation transporter [Sulfobacillus thermosulfidooxidans]SMC02372.1 Mn2+ and Fe2+ transporters of the NRAMP family [Sulfobacillus thermosulfidooxidans DSM 9293]